MSGTGSYSLMVHGGAGALDNVKDDKTAFRYLDSIRRTLEHGRDVMQLGGSVLQAVEACASLLEDDPVFNAGCGSVLNENGKVEMDAAIMDGRDPLPFLDWIYAYPHDWRWLDQAACRFEV